MKKHYKRLLLVAVGILISAAAVLYFIRGMRGEWAAMGKAFTGANYLYLVPSVGLIGVMYALRMLRWRVFLDPIAKVPYSAIASATCIGFMATCLLPLRPGEIIRPYVLHRKSGISFGHAAGTAPGLERVFDLMGTCFLLLLTWLALWARSAPAGAPPRPAAPAAVQAVATPAAGSQASERENGEARLSEFVKTVVGRGVYFAVLMAVGLGALSAAAFFPAAMLKLAGFVLGFLPRSWNEALVGLVRSFLQALGFLKSPGRVAAALLLTFAIWFCYPVSTYSLARGFGLHIPFAGALVAQSVITAAVAAPQAPGFIGTFHKAAQWSVGMFGVATGDAGAFAMMLWAVNVIPITVVGLGFLSVERLNLLRLAQASRRAADEIPAGGAKSP
jgi:hypothetical protein